MNRLMAATACVALLLSGCQRGPTLETRTFEIHYLSAGNVEGIVGPYVYADREADPGMMSSGNGAITVRETPDNLEKIARVLAQYDVPPPDVRLRFQLIEADGYTDEDPAIADVETELRKLFQFRGYRLAGEALVQATDGTEVQQALSGSPSSLYQVTARVFGRSDDGVRLDGVQLWVNGDPVLKTSVNIRPGQTLVLGSSPKKGSTATLLLTVRAEEIAG